MGNTNLPDLGVVGRGLTDAYMDQMRSVMLGQGYISEELRQRSMSMENRLTEFAAERGSVSNEFATISEHIVDALREASRSSTFERADQIATMKYIRDIINTKVTDADEQERLLAAWQEATDSIKNHTTIFSKAQNLLINQIGTFAGIFASMIPNLPPIFGVLATQGGNLLGKWLERRKIRKERRQNLSEEIDAQNRNGNVSNMGGFRREEEGFPPPGLDGFQGEQEPSQIPGTENPFRPVPGSDLFRNGIFGEGFVRETGESVSSNDSPTPTPLNHVPGRRGFRRVLPDGTKRKPFFVRSVGKKDEKDEKGLLGKLFSLIMGSALFKAIAGFLTAAGGLLSGKMLAGAVGSAVAGAASRLGIGGRTPPSPDQPPRRGVFQRVRDFGSGVLQKGKDAVSSGVGFIKEKGAAAKEAVVSGLGKVKEFGSSALEKGKGLVSSGLEKAKGAVGAGIEKGKALFAKSGQIIKAIPWKNVAMKFGAKNAIRTLAVVAGLAAAPLSAGASTAISAASGTLLAKDLYDIGQMIRDAMNNETEESVKKTEEKAKDIMASVSGNGGMEPQKESGFDLEKPKTEPISTESLGKNYIEKSRVLQSVTQSNSTSVVQNTPVSVTNVTNVNNTTGKSSSPTVIVMDNPNSGIAAGYWAR